MNKQKNILTAATKEAGEFSKAKIVWLVHPLLEQLALAFTAYIGMESQTANGKPLIVAAMKNALASYHKHEDDERAAIAAFVASLLENSRDVFSQQIVVATPKGHIVWSPFAGGLAEFLEAYPNAEVTVSRQECKIAESIAKTFMMTKIIPHTLLDQASLAELFNTDQLTV